MNDHPRRVPGSQGGFALTESLVAIVIFSIGILGVVGFRSAAVREVTESKVRTQAAFLAASLVSEMWSNRNRLDEYHAPTGAHNTVAQPWFEQVKRELPGSAAAPPLVVVQPDGRVAITMRWRIAASSMTGQYRLATQIVDP